MAKFKDRLNEVIRIKNIRQRDLAEKTGIHDATIHNYRIGKYEPKSDKIYIIAKCLEISPAWLSGFDVPMDSGLIDEKKELIDTISKKLDKLSIDSLEVIDKLCDNLGGK